MSPWSSGRLEPTLGELRFATFVGLATIPAVGVLYWLSVPNIALGVPVVIAGVIVGYRYDERSTSSRRAGRRVGLAAAIPIGLVLSIGWAIEMAWHSVAIDTGVLLLAVGIVLNVLYYYVSGVAGGMIGAFLAQRARQS